MNDDTGIWRILVVDDSRTDAAIIVSLLKKDGHEITCCLTGEEAVDAAGNGQSFDVIIMDVDLGDGISGIEAAELIFRTCKTPVIFLTSHPREDITCVLGEDFEFGYISKFSYTAKLIRKAIHMAHCHEYHTLPALHDINFPGK